MTQLKINFEQARAARDSGMQQALDHAQAENPDWKTVAYTWLIGYAKTHPSFISEDVGDAYEAAGLPAPPTRRAWGSLYTKAAREGYITQDGMGRSRMRHASICPRWRSLVCRTAA
jgi:hypothetical protein